MEVGNYDIYDPEYDWAGDPSTIGDLARLSRRINQSPDYQARFKAGNDWLEVFRNRPAEVRNAEFSLAAKQTNPYLGVKHTLESVLGFIYLRLLDRCSPEGIEDFAHFGHIRTFVNTQLEEACAAVANLQTEPEKVWQLALTSYSGETVNEAAAKMTNAASACELKWDERKPKVLEPLVQRAALIRALNIPLTADNLVPIGPSFQANWRNESGFQITQLFWGWGNPHVFYGREISGLPLVEGEKPLGHITIAEKVVVALADNVVRDFQFLDSFPQDMVYPQQAA